MTTKLSALGAFAFALAVLTGVATASPVVTKQRIVVQSGSEGGFDSFELTPLTPGPVAKDTGSASACCWSRHFIKRDGQAIEIDDPLKTFVGQRGTFVYRARIEWVDAGHGNTVGTGTWRVVSGTGSYAHLEGHGRLAVLWPMNAPTSFRAEGFVDLNRGTRKLSAAGSSPKIAFVRTTFKPYRSHLFVMNLDRSGLRQLTYGNSLDTDYSWSPDGRRIVFTRRVYERPGRDLFTIGVDGSGLRRLTRSGLPAAPSWSPDGSTIVYEDATRTGQYGLSLISPDGSGARSLALAVGTRPAGQPKNPSWAPDGKSIAFSSAGAVVVVDLEGAVERRIAPVGGRGAYDCAAWSTDGRRLGFVDAWNDSVLVGDLQTGSERRVAVHAGGLGFAWSPDGKRISYSGDRLNGVHSVGVDGTQDVRLTPDSVAEGLPLGGLGWSNDGRVVYASDRTGRGDIYLVDELHGGVEERQLTSGPGIDGDPSWSQARDTGARGGLPK